VDFKRSLITFRDTKNGSTGTVRMNATARMLLESLPHPINPSLPVFTVDRHKVRYRFDLAVEKAGIKRCCAGCRQVQVARPAPSAATELIARGATLNDVRDFLRHKTLAMTLRYAHLLDDRRANTAALLDQSAPTGRKPLESRRPVAETVRVDDRSADISRVRLYLPVCGSASGLVSCADFKSVGSRGNPAPVGSIPTRFRQSSRLAGPRRSRNLCGPHPVP